MRARSAGTWALPFSGSIRRPASATSARPEPRRPGTWLPTSGWGPGGGSYLARTISYGPTRRLDGTAIPESAVEYEPLVHQLTEAEQRQYDEIADLWSELLIAFEEAEHNACQKRHGGRYAQFYSAQQRFFLQLM